MTTMTTTRMMVLRENHAGLGDALFSCRRVAQRRTSQVFRADGDADARRGERRARAETARAHVSDDRAW